MQLKLRFQKGNTFSFKKNLMLLLFLGVSFGAFAQSVITGKVTDISGEPIIGASIRVKGTNSGTVTDVSGVFKLNGTGNETILISYIGFQPQEISVSGKSNILIQLKDDEKSLDEVIVVGYGTQKKASLTGSVSQVKGDDVLKGKTTTSVAEGLQGVIPGLTITRTSSRPGNEGIALNIRGGISVNQTDPLIIVDGVEAYTWELSQINPNDIETVSVLKDAAAAIYGTKAGAGVILITTKRGKDGKTKVTYSGSVHANILGKKFPVADGTTWAQMLVRDTESDGRALLDASGNPQNNWWMWPEATWRALAAGNTYSGVLAGKWRMLDPSSNQFDAVYGDTWGETHNLSISGGNENLKVMTSLGYAEDRSLVKVAYDGQKKYNFRTNADYKVNNWIKAEFNTSYDNRTVSTPTQGIGNGIQDFYVFPLYNPYGQYYDTFGNNNILAKLVDGGRTNDTQEFFRLGGKVTFDLKKLIKGLTIDGSANVRSQNHYIMSRQTKVTLYDWSGETAASTGLPDYSLTSGAISSQTTNANSWVKNTYEKIFFQTYNAFIHYNREFFGHNIGVMAGMTTEKFGYQKLYGYRSNMSVNELNDINLGDATTAQATGGSYENGLISYLGRLNYDYKGIYLIEGTFRRDGSSKFNEANRWADFAGVSGGLRLSELPVIKNLSAFDNLKLRASYGETGSQTGIGNYDYISSIANGTTVFGYSGTLNNTSWISSMTTDQRTWERVASSNLGLDFATLNNRLSGTFEVYKRVNNDMLISMTYPQTLGTNSPKTNSGNFSSKGWELELNWNDKIGKDFTYHVGFALSDALTNIDHYTGGVVISNGINNTIGASQFIEGKPLNALYVYKTDGYLQTTDEVKAYYTAITKTAGGIQPVQNTTSQLTPGSVKKVDLNGDGKITTDDLYYYGDANPHDMFSLTLGAKFKNFDFSMFIQGVGQQNVLRTGILSSPWSATYTNQNLTFYGNTWTPDNTNARYPVASRDGSRNNWNYKQFNDININSCWYARAKNVVVGYTLPKMLVKKVKIDNLRFYISADNLFEVSNVKDGFDPESQAAANQGNVDVFARTLTFGLDLTF